MPGPLEGLRILDFTTLTAGGEATGFLRDLGADIIKIEPAGGEAGRRLTVLPSGVSPFFLPQNRGKRSVVLDLQSPEGRETILQLSRTCDALVHNFRPGVMERLRLSYNDVREANPAIVYAETSGFGAEGPDAGLASVDIIGQARGGLMSVTGDSHPTPAGAIVSDYLAAMHLAIGVLSALLSRANTGKGQKVVGSMLGSMISAQAWEFTHFLMTGRSPRRAARGHPLLAESLWGVYDTADGHIAIAGITPDKLPAVAAALGCPELAGPPFGGPEGRTAPIGEFRALVQATFARWDTAALFRILASHDVRCSPVQDYAALAEDPQVAANGYIVEFEHPRAGWTKMAGNPLRFSDAALDLAVAEPMLGEHTAEVLAEVGLSAGAAGPPTATAEASQSRRNAL